ncbi:MAG: DUF373 family protein [Thermoplasmatota archaeon]
MKKLILCVDRDDDIGSKTGLDTPLIGREANLNAAVKLGLKDPEDSDTNSLFSALSTYDELKKKGENVEIATICGTQSIGYNSDKALNEELKKVIEKTNPDTAILVSDGAEDEYIIPIISSKVDISHVKTVHVKQLESVENLYYIIVKSLQEEKAKKKILLPISLALLVYGFFGVVAVIYGLTTEGLVAISRLSPSFGIGVIAFVIGGYLIGRIYNLDEKAIYAYKGLRKAISTASVWLPFTIVAILIVVASGIRGWNTIMELEERTTPIILLSFASEVIWWWIGAIFLHELGQVIHLYITQGEVKRSFWAVIFSMLALTFIFWGAFQYIKIVIGEEGASVLPMVAINIILGLLIGVLGGITHRSVEDKKPEESASEGE